jgi:putative Holliday junction resolvase
VRLLGIDFGAARTGLALSDPLAMTCSPLEIVHERDEDRLVERIRQVVASHEVSEVVLGHPRPLSGGTNAQQQAAEAFATRLSADLDLPVHLWDERFTTKLAERVHAGGQPPASPSRGGFRKGSSRRDRAQGSRLERAGGQPPRDAVAACHLLQSYLNVRDHDAGRGAP